MFESGKSHLASPNYSVSSDNTNIPGKTIEITPASPSTINVHGNIVAQSPTITTSNTIVDIEAEIQKSESIDFVARQNYHYCEVFEY